MTTAIETTLLEQIADELESWDDGWGRIHGDPRELDRRLTMFRRFGDENDLRTELTIAKVNSRYYLHGCGYVDGRGRYSCVSISLRNDVNRKAIDYINRMLDEAEGGVAALHILQSSEA